MTEERAPYHAGRACFQCESGRMARTTEPEPGWKCTTCAAFQPDDQTTPRPRAFIRVKLGSAAADWRSVELLEIGLGRVRVEDENGPIWVEIEHAHPDDRRRIQSTLLCLRIVISDQPLAPTHDGSLPTYVNQNKKVILCPT